MKLYLAALIANDMLKGGKLHSLCSENEQWNLNHIPHVLESYHYMKSQNHQKKWKFSEKQVFLDSGAFSAFNIGVKVDLKAYVKFCHQYAPLIVNDECLCASVLDAVGDARKTYENQKAMEAEGITPLPCFHYGEPIEYLKHYIENYSYITLGGMVPISTKQLYVWLDDIWSNYLTDSHGAPRLKVHGFGITTLGIIQRYPWHSVDSSSWVQVGNMGNIVMFHNNKLYTLAISDNSKQLKETGKHYLNLQEEYRQIIDNQCKEFGLVKEDLFTKYTTRRIFNCCTYRKIESSVAKYYKKEIQSIFDFI